MLMGYNIVIYGKEECSNCEKLKDILKNTKHKYLTYGVDFTTEDLKELYPDVIQYPVINYFGDVYTFTDFCKNYQTCETSKKI